MIRQKHGFYWRLIFLLLWFREKLCCIYKVFRLVQGGLLWVKHFKSQYKLLPFDAMCNLISKVHDTSKVWSVKFMDPNHSQLSRTRLIGTLAYQEIDEKIDVNRKSSGISGVWRKSTVCNR